MKFLPLLTAVMLVGVARIFAAADPVVTTQISDLTLYNGAPAAALDLSQYFTDPDATAAVQVTTVLGTMNFILYPQTPITTANFLNYVNSGRYFVTDATTHQQASTFIHRVVPGFIIQGGGFLGTSNPTVPANALPTQVATFSPIQNEPGISNKRGTISMAKQDGDPNSATSQWFINLADNSANLDNQNGGFTVFGRVAGSGMSVADAIAAVPNYNLGSAFTNLPLRNYSTADYNSGKSVAIANLVSVPGLAQISPLNFSATSDAPANVSVAISGTNLLVTAHQIGSAHITVTATDLDGGVVSQSFNVTVVTAPGRLVNISTRLQVGTSDNVLIAGFFVQGGATKRLLVRGIGPSLSSSGITNFLADPVLELHDASGNTIATNDNWGDAANKQQIIDTGIAPSNAQESAILATVPAGSSAVAYTAILKGVNNTTGIGLVEAYDLDSGASSTVLNISTRGRVDTGNGVLIGGFFLGGSESKKILIRAIGPSLANSNVMNPLADPTLELHDANGTTVDSNDNWQSYAHASDVQASGIAPTNAKESAVLDTLAPSAYTAIVRGVNDTTGVANVEAYQLP